MRADMILLDRATPQPYEGPRQVKPESMPRSSFQCTLQKEMGREQQTRASSGRQEASGQGTETKGIMNEPAGKNSSIKEKTAGTATATEPAAEAANPAGEESPEAAAQEGLDAEMLEGLVTASAAQSPQTVSSGQENLELSNGSSREGRVSQDKAPWMKLAYAQPGLVLVQTADPGSANSNGIVPWPAGADAGVQLDTSHPEQTAASSVKQGTSTGDLQSSPLLSIASKTGGQNAEEAQGKINNQSQQTARELAELESRKLTGQKTDFTAEQNQTGRDSRSDYNYQAVRPEGPVFKAPDSTSMMTNKTTEFDSNLDTQQILNQIVRKAELMVKSNSSEMKIELYPEFLGKLTIKIMVEEGAVTAKFITDNHQVKQMLDANLNMLRQSLENQGMRVERAEVDVQLNNGGLFDGSQGQRDWNWDNRYSPHSGNSSLKDQEVYQIAQELVPAESPVYEAYGIGLDGSLNFVI